MSFPRFPNQPEPKEKYGFEISYIFSENISRVWNCLKSIPLISVIEPSLLSQVYLIKGKNTWTEGSEFKGYWVGVSYLSGKCVKVDNSPNTKTISWVYDLAIQISFTKTINLYEITNTDTTLVILKVELIATDQVDYQPVSTENDSYIQLYTNLLKKFDKYLKENPINLTNYQSCVIPQNMKVLWDFITNFNKVTTISKLFADKFEYKGDLYQKGTFIKGLNGPNNKAIFLRVKSVQNDPNSKIWNYIVETFGTNNAVVKQDLEISVIGITKETSQLSFTHIFHSTVPKSQLLIFSEEKKKFLENIQHYFQNQMIKK